MSRKKYWLWAAPILAVFVLASLMIFASSVSAEDLGVAVNEENFPDEIFREYVSTQIDKNGDGYLSENDIENATSVLVWDMGISSLEGIQYFTSLERIGCNGNNLTELDLSVVPTLKYLYCTNNELTELDLSCCPLIEELNFSGNPLTSLNLSGCTEIQSLTVSEETLTSIDLSGTCIEYLTVSGTQLTELDLTGLSSLITLYCNENENLTTVLMDGCTSLDHISCPDNAITELDLSDLFALDYLYCYGNQLTELDISSCPLITYIECGDNLFTELDVSGCAQLSYFSCGPNAITELDLTGCEALYSLYLWGCDSLESIKLDGCTSLNLLYADGCSLSDIDISSCPALKSLYISDNNFTELTLESETLEILECTNNAIESLDVSGCPALLRLYCSSNLLTSLDISNNSNLTHLNCSYNMLTSLDVSGTSVAETQVATSYSQSSSGAVPSKSTRDREYATEFECDSNSYTITIEDALLEIDTETLPGSFDVDRVSDLTGMATLDGSIIKINSTRVKSITYSYDCGNGCTAKFTIEIVINPFTDVSIAQWFYEPVMWAYQNSFMTGRTEDTFAPDNTMTRAEFVTVLYRMENGEAGYIPVNDNPFTDVAAAQWFYNYVMWAYDNGIVNGTSETTFDPDGSITREQIAAILYRRYGENEIVDFDLDTFTDADQIDEYAVNAMKWAAKNGIFGGYEDGSVKPRASATRAEVAKILMYYVESAE